MEQWFVRLFRQHWCVHRHLHRPLLYCREERREQWRELYDVWLSVHAGVRRALVHHQDQGNDQGEQRN